MFVGKLLKSKNTTFEAERIWTINIYIIIAMYNTHPTYIYYNATYEVK